MAEKETAGKKRRLGDMQLFWRRGVQYGEVDLPFFLIVIALLVMACGYALQVPPAFMA